MCKRKCNVFDNSFKTEKSNLVNLFSFFQKKSNLVHEKIGRPSYICNQNLWGQQNPNWPIINTITFYVVPPTSSQFSLHQVTLNPSHFLLKLLLLHKAVMAISFGIYLLFLLNFFSFGKCIPFICIRTLFFSVSFPLFILWFM